MKLLPIELLYCVGDFLEPFDKINMNYALNIKIPIKNLKQAIDNFTSDNNLQLILYKIITIERRIDNLNIIKEIFEIIKHKDLCFSFCNLIYNFTLKKGESSLITSKNYYDYDIVCKNTNLLKKVLVDYIQFEIIKDYLCFTVNCNVINILRRGH